MRRTKQTTDQRTKQHPEDQSKKSKAQNSPRHRRIFPIPEHLPETKDQVIKVTKVDEDSRPKLMKTKLNQTKVHEARQSSTELLKNSTRDRVEWARETQRTIEELDRSHSSTWLLKNSTRESKVGTQVLKSNRRVWSKPLGFRLAKSDRWSKTERQKAPYCNYHLIKEAKRVGFAKKTHTNT